MQRRWSLSVLGILIMLTMATTAELFLIPSLEAKRQHPSCLVTTTGGDVQGVDNGVSCSFLGIPFAAPPIGDLRWRPPQPAPSWAPATLAVTTAVAMCPQVNPAGSTTVVGIEDCLKLNVWTPDPAPASPVPVIVWIHTGAFQAASRNLADSNPQKLVERTGAIVVAANYPIGPLGFMGHPALTGEDPGYPSSGNYGFLDQRAALAWVRDNIAAFGGDPGNVTIDGQSAGGHSVSLHVVSPGSAGYFHRAIMQSGYASTRWRTRADAESLGTVFAADVGCTDPTQVLACMRSKTRNEVLLAFGNGQQEFAETGRVPWGPVVDGLDIPDQPRRLYEAGDFNHVPLVMGATRDEGWIYVDRSFPAGLTEEQYEPAVVTEFGAADAPAVLAQYPASDFPTPKLALSQLSGDVEAVCEARRIARLVRQTRTPAYLYSFEREVDAVVPDLVIHGLDRNFVFGNNFGPPSPPYVLNGDDLSLFAAISTYWTRFAASGNPNGDDDGTIRWPAFRQSIGHGSGGSKYLVLDWPLREDKRLREEQCDFWEPFFLKSIVNGSTSASSPSSDLCGATIVADMRLDYDLECPGNGLIVGADGIKIDLNGHTIAGPGSGVGISVSNRTGVVITGGTVKNFLAGVQLVNSTGISIKKNQFTGNQDAVFLIGSSGNIIKENAAWQNSRVGVMLRPSAIKNSTENLVAENTLTDNLNGIILVDTPTDNTFKENMISGSGRAGIALNGGVSSNVIRENTFTGNAAGILFNVGAGGLFPTANTFVKNMIAMNTCGVQGPAGDNAFKRNQLQGNVADVCS